MEEEVQESKLDNKKSEEELDKKLLTAHLAPSFFEKVQIGRSGGPEFWVIWKVRDPQDLIFKTPNRGPESPLPSQKSERPSGPHF